MIHRLLFSARNIVAKSSIALLLGILIASVVAVPAFATDGVLYTSGYADGYYYECTYTPIDDHDDDDDGDGYHVTCNYTSLDDDDDDDNGDGDSCPSGCLHTVQLGDNLSTIAAHYETSFTDLAEENDLEYPYYLYVGNVLEVPCDD